ncbi:hypothetical protein AHAS_Ahas04G0119300 [Arachis hypogaea]
MIIETAIGEALQCRHIPDDLCAHQQAELAIPRMTFDYEALRSVIGLPDATWVMDANNTKPKGMLFAHLTREARTWQMIFAHYFLPTTHFSEIPHRDASADRVCYGGEGCLFSVTYPTVHVAGAYSWPTSISYFGHKYGVPS